MCRIAGYDVNKCSQAPSVGLALRLLLTIPPIFAWAAAFFLLSAYHIDARPSSAPRHLEPPASSDRAAEGPRATERAKQRQYQNSGNEESEVDSSAAARGTHVESRIEASISLGQLQLQFTIPERRAASAALGESASGWPAVTPAVAATAAAASGTISGGGVRGRSYTEAGSRGDAGRGANFDENEDEDSQFPPARARTQLF